jgi:ubiquinone/menaquinone biosynthesis C-methylase UbiE
MQSGRKVQKDKRMKPVYWQEPAAKAAYTARNDAAYTRSARIYAEAVRHLPVWRSWLEQALPHIRGPRVLEVSFGTGYLLTQYAGHFEAFGIDYNMRMIRLTQQSLRSRGVTAHLQQADVAALPYGDGTFDTVVNTMAFSGYPDGYAAMAEMHRVLRPGGRLVLIDINYPRDGNRPGILLTRLWITLGDIVRDLEPLFQAFGFACSEREIGGVGTVHLYLAERS